MIAPRIPHSRRSTDRANTRGMRWNGSPRHALTVLLLGAIASVPSEAAARQTPVQGLPLAMRHAPEDAPARDVGSPPAAEPVAPATPEPAPTPEAPTDATATVPAAPSAEAGVPEAPPTESTEPSPPGSSEVQAEPPAEVAPTLLEADPEPRAPEPRRPVIVESEDPESQDAALRRAYADRYRPVGN